MSGFEVTPRNRVRLMPDRGHYDRDTVYAIVDEALVCHVGFVADGQPVVMPTLHARRDDLLYLHGSRGNAMLKHVQAGNPVCVTITHIDGIVFARSAFHHSVNYRSAVLFGRGRLLEEPAEKMAALERLVEHVARGRWSDSRLPTEKELKLTSVIEFGIDSASAKIRTGPPKDDEEDYALPHWAGVLPFRQQILAPVADPKLAGGIAVPEYITSYRRPGST
jgi:nitroimidazol reductase NimA-like FMN-containing flavoprotein (pyridoxamine 5'-phosphate oxidase superfamily)